MESRTREVRFDVYCQDCKYFERREDQDPCWDCLNQGWNWDSHKPVYYKETLEVQRDA